MNANPFSEYIIFIETAVTEVSQKIFPLEELMKHLNKYRRILENLTPSKLGILMPLVIQNESGFSIALALKPASQGSLLTGNGIEESARKEQVEKIQAAEKIALSSIQSGKRLARKLSEQKVSEEEFNRDMQDVEDEKIAREAMHLERMPPSLFDYPGKSVSFEGNRKNPTHVFSDKKVTYNQCVVRKNLGNGVFQIYTPDALQALDKMVAKNGFIEVSCEEGSSNDTLIQLTHLLKAIFEFDALLSDEIRTGKKALRIAQIDNEKITSEIDAQWTDFKENLSLGF